MTRKPENTYTRPQRRLLWMVCFLVGWIAVIAWLWGPSGSRWQATTAGSPLGAGVSTYGLVGFLEVSHAPVTANGVATAGAQRTYEFRPWSAALLLVLSSLFTGAAIWGFRHYVVSGRLSGRCDECGYDLAGIRSDRCPECGVAIG